MKIAFVDYVLEPDKPGRSGLSDVVWDMASELVNQGHEAHIVASYHTTSYPDPRVIVHNFPTPPIGYRNIVGQLWILKRATDIVKQIAPDIVHSAEYVSTAVMATLGVRTPLVLTVPGNIFERIQKGHGYDRHYVEVLKWAARTSARRCASVIAISKEMKRWWEWTGSPPERTPVIPYGIDPARFHPIPGARKRLGIPEDKLFLLYVGRFSPEKGLLDLIDALARNRPLLDPSCVEVALVGKGPQGDELRQRIVAADLNQVVHIRDWVAQEELSTWYSAADALVMPSWNEPLGRVMLEAMACGTPVIASATEGPIDHVQEENTGMLFAPNDVNALAEIITSLIRDRKKFSILKTTTQQYAHSRLLWCHVIEAISNEVYKKYMPEQCIKL
jgi:glycosyltransferase involved in cell wall biosynthesis